MYPHDRAAPMTFRRSLQAAAASKARQIVIHINCMQPVSIYISVAASVVVESAHVAHIYFQPRSLQWLARQCLSFLCPDAVRPYCSCCIGNVDVDKAILPAGERPFCPDACRPYCSCCISRVEIDLAILPACRTGAILSQCHEHQLSFQ